MESRNVIELYFQWLTDQVCSRQEKRDYEDLMRLLYSTTFTYELERDGNRAADGVNLRSKFADEYGIDFETRHNAITGPCTVLELLIGLADRAVFSMIDGEITGEKDEMHWIFWKMLENLGLVALKNAQYSRSKAKRRIDVFMNRKYAYNGENGGLFVVREPAEDLREVEIWKQMCWYISELNGY